MPTLPFDFHNASGDRLSGRIELPQRPPHAWAVLTHCFTCGRDNLAAVRIARRLATGGIGVLRFDFTGLGSSEGEFADTDFGGNVQDLIAAVAAMTAAGMAPTLLIGHSLGGAAALAAAGALPAIRAVATIAAPFEVAHALQQIAPEALAQIERDGSARVVLGGRPLTIGRSFVEDVREHQQGPRIAALHRPLLVLHSPADRVVPVDNATRIFVAAHHPKSFVALDGADHLLSKAGDAEFAADLIATWAGRYLVAPVTTADDIFDAEAEETGLGKFQLSMRAGAATFLADEPVAIGGLGSGASPFDLLSAALAACTTMTLRLFVANKGWAVDRIGTQVAHAKDPLAQPPDQFSRRISIAGGLDDEQRATILSIADRCPVHRALEHGSRITDAELHVTASTGNAS